MNHLCHNIPGPFECRGTPESFVGIRWKNMTFLRGVVCSAAAAPELRKVLSSFFSSSCCIRFLITLQEMGCLAIPSFYHIVSGFVD